MTQEDIANWTAETPAKVEDDTAIPAFLDRTEGTPEEVKDGEVVQTESDVGPADETVPF